MNSSPFDPTLFLAIFPAELLPLAVQLELAVYTSEAFDLCAPPMGGWHYVGPAGLSQRELEVNASWRRTIPEAVGDCAVNLARALKSHCSCAIGPAPRAVAGFNDPAQVPDQL